MSIRTSFACLMVATCAVAPVHAQVNGLGSTTFENSGAPEAQDAFLRGILLLHSFEYPDAQEEFRKAREIDPGFAMAYWGEAMANHHPIWMSQNLDEARAVLEELGPTREDRQKQAPTEREKDYLRAAEVLFYGAEEKRERDVAYMKVMEWLSEKYPDDLDAAAWYSLAILGTAHDGRDFATYMRAAAVAERVFAENPNHPGAAHYLIHSYDDAVHAPLGLRAANAYAGIAPEAAHALHMPSHIFVAMGMWDRVAESNEESYAASEMRRKRKDLGVGARSFHARHWQMYAYLQLGRYEEARQLLSDMEADAAEEAENSGIRRHMAIMRAAYVVETNAWDSDVARMKLNLDDLDAAAEAMDRFVYGMAMLKAGDVDSASEQIMAIMEPTGYHAGEAEVMRDQLKAAKLMHEGHREEAIKLLVRAAEDEDALPFDYGPPSPVKPAREMLGEFYLKDDQADLAVAAFEASLARAPKRALSLMGLAKAADAAGDHEKARRARATLEEMWHSADSKLAKLLPKP